MSWSLGERRAVGTGRRTGWLGWVGAGWWGCGGCHRCLVPACPTPTEGPEVPHVCGSGCHHGGTVAG